MPARGRHFLNGDAAVVIAALKARRQQLGIGCEILDDQLGYATGMTNKWENGTVSPTLVNLQNWANHLGLHVQITSGRQPTLPFAEAAYRAWLKTTKRLNTPKARALFKRLAGI